MWTQPWVLTCKINPPWVPSLFHVPHNCTDVLICYTHCKPRTQIKTGEVKRGYAQVLMLSSFALADCLREAHGNSFWSPCSIVTVHCTIPTENPLQMEPGRPGQNVSGGCCHLVCLTLGERKKKQLLELPHLGSDKQIKCLDKMSTLENPFGLFAQHSWVC